MASFDPPLGWVNDRLGELREALRRADRRREEVAGDVARSFLACEQNITLREDHGLPLPDRALSAWARAAQHAGDGATLRAILKRAHASDPYSEEAESIASIVKRFDRDQADVEAARARLAEARAKGEDPTRREDALARELMSAGHWQEARTLLEGAIQRRPEDASLREGLVGLTLQIHDVPGARAALQSWQDSGVELDAGRVRAVRELPDQSRSTTEAQGYAVLLLGSKLQGAGLLWEAADAWYRLGTELPETKAMDPQSALTLAATMYGQAWNLEGQWKTYSAIIDRWPESDAARSAAQMRAMLPEP